MVNISLRDVSEHDMDMLILEEMVCSAFFRKLFYDKIGLDCSFEVLDAYRSLADSDGESDLTFILSDGTKKHALLIENKIDAVTMKNQSDRYVIRAEKAVNSGLYDSYSVMLACPGEYWDEHRNDPNANYQCVIFYEELLTVFAEPKNIRNSYKAQVIETAIAAKKKGYQVIENKAVTDFWITLREFCNSKYPSLILLGDDSAKGSEACWPEFKTALKRTKIVYKSNKGYVDFQIAEYGDRIGSLMNIVEDKLDGDMNIYPAKKSAAIRLRKAEWAISFKQPFCDVESIIDDVLKNVLRFVRLAEQIDYNSLYNLDSFSHQDVIRAHRFSNNHKEDLEREQKCGCFYCLSIFNSSEIKDWLVAPNPCDRNGTALCPECGIDSVIGESSGYPITPEFLKAMNKRWFG